MKIIRILLCLLILLSLAGCSTPRIFRGKETLKANDSIVQLETSKNSITQDAQEIRARSETIVQTASKLDTVSKDIVALQNTIAEQQDEVNSLSSKIYVVGIALCVIVMGIGVMLGIYVSLKLGIAVAMMGGVTAAVAYVVATYAWLFGLLALAIILAVIGYACYLLYDHKHIIDDLIKSFEIQKDKHWQDSTKKEIDLIQSKKTKKAIKDIKLKHRM